MIRKGVDKMYTLYIDTHMNKIVIVLYQEEQVKIKKEVVTNYNHSITTMPIIQEVIEGSNLTVRDLNQIIVVNGPGSFTGVRLGVTIAKTLAYTLNIPIKEVSSLFIKAVSFSHEEVSVIEREKNGVFLGNFDKNNNLIGDYEYIKNSDFDTQNTKMNFKENIELDYEKIIKASKQIPEKNPHAINPIYIKKIEVEK